MLLYWKRTIHWYNLNNRFSLLKDKNTHTFSIEWNHKIEKKIESFFLLFSFWSNYLLFTNSDCLVVFTDLPSIDDFISLCLCQNSAFYLIFDFIVYTLITWQLLILPTNAPPKWQQVFSPAHSINLHTWWHMAWFYSFHPRV